MRSESWCAGPKLDTDGPSKRISQRGGSDVEIAPPPNL
jgi:hypothetical protein